MNYYDSDCFKLAKEFKRELDRIKDDGMLIDSVSHVGAQLNKAVLCYEYANFAAEMSRRIDDLNRH